MEVFKSGRSSSCLYYDNNLYLKQFFPVKIEYKKEAWCNILTYKDYDRYLDQHWRPLAMEMVNHHTGKSTILQFSDYEFKAGLSPRDFN